MSDAARPSAPVPRVLALVVLGVGAFVAVTAFLPGMSLAAPWGVALGGAAIALLGAFMLRAPEGSRRRWWLVAIALGFAVAHGLALLGV